MPYIYLYVFTMVTSGLLLPYLLQSADREDSIATGSKVVLENTAALSLMTAPEVEPEVKPPKLSKRDIIPDITKLSLLDQHVVKCPTTLRSSLPSLVKYLTEPAKNRLEQVWTFYRWITHAISFDMSIGADDRYDKDTDHFTVLRNGSTVSEGFARLMEALCVEAGIPVKVLSGYCKGFAYQIGDVISTEESPNHVWNAVHIGGNWYFLDCMWGAGYVNEKGQFVREFNEFWFLTDSEKFIHTHFPYLDQTDDALNTKWQLMRSPISLANFSDMMKLEDAALDWGVEPVSHKSHVINVRRQVDVFLQETDVPVDEYTIKLYQPDFGWTLDEFLLTYKTDEKTLKIHIILPHEEDYVLHIFGQKRGDDAVEPKLLLIYILHCTEVNLNLRTYPTHYWIYGAVPEYQTYGFLADICRPIEHVCDNGELILPMKSKGEVSVIVKLEHVEIKDDLGSFVMINGKGMPGDKKGYVGIHARLPYEGYYKLSVFGKQSDTENYRPVITYLVDCKRAMENCKAFPQTFSAALQYKCRLLEPLVRELPAETLVKISLFSQQLTKVRVMDTFLNRQDFKQFEGAVMTPGRGQPFTVFGADNEQTPVTGLFHFNIV